MSDTRPGGAPAHVPDGEAPLTPAARGEREGAEPVDTAPPGGGAPAGTPAPTTPGGGADATEPAADTPPSVDELRPAQIVSRLDEFIIGQDGAKRAVAVALRNRLRRQRLPEAMRAEVIPKNILMIGPTGVGKTEIARRLARLTRSPFIKVEATKFTEVGYVGRDVEAIIRDLLEQTITEVHNDRVADVEGSARETAEERILDALLDAEAREAQEGSKPARGSRVKPAATPPAAEVETETEPETEAEAERETEAEAPAPDGKAASDGDAASEAARRRRRLQRRRLRQRLRARQLEDRVVEIEVEEPYQPMVENVSGAGFEDMGATLADFLSQLAPPRKRMKRMTVADARTALVDEETDRLIDMDRVYDEAIRSVEDSGIVFIDEVDKIAGQGSEHGPDVSGEGVQRDLLPVLEGSTVHTRYGAVHTDHILFIAAGAFTMSRPSDLIPEFQGRFPIRVELKALNEADLERILVEPSNSLTKQYTALLGTEGVTLEFSPDGLRELAHQAAQVNQQDENIGARRLFTILEKVLEDVSFRADEFAGTVVTVDAAMVRARLGDLVRNEDLRRYVL
ncbi:MAG: ATP-dependent HslUV protease ATP-binding subunit HslU [Chloroflexota bacterium]|jgi:ATP-dependent HslUV protease ATP-binding subunit HslU|nr:ATP-dependent HslUV protease ATP-binding subunit HslU [Chloroflexota bacterium]